jgi:hypothetical protein
LALGALFGVWAVGAVLALTGLAAVLAVLAVFGVFAVLAVGAVSTLGDASVVVVWVGVAGVPDAGAEAVAVGVGEVVSAMAMDAPPRTERPRAPVTAQAAVERLIFMRGSFRLFVRCPTVQRPEVSCRGEVRESPLTPSCRMLCRDGDELARVAR